MFIERGHDFNDLLLVPRLSTVNSRDEVDLSVKLSEFLTLKIPIIASPMKGIISTGLITKLHKLGGIGILHRFYQPYGEEFLNDMTILFRSNENFGISTDLKDSGDRINVGLNYGARILCIDVANGYTTEVLKACSRFKNYIIKHGFKCLLMAGNVVTENGAKALEECGVDLIRVGIGSGNLCTTRNVTGVGYPQLSAIMSCNNCDSFIVADGGIKNSGDAVKSLAAGADLVMLGSLLAHTYESSNNGIICGMASRKMQEEYYHGKIKSIEGIEKEVEKNISLEDFISEFTYGIKSACTYINARNLVELRNNAKFVEVSRSSIKEL